MSLRPRWFALLVLGSSIGGPARAQDQALKVTPQWDRVVRTSKTTPTLQVVVNPPLRRGNPVHDGAFKALRELQADYVRYVPWLPYPKLGVAELAAPKDGKTSWDFSLIDPMTIDFLEATKGRPVVLNFSTIPQWMVKTEKPVAYPENPDQPVWDYTQGSDFLDPTFKQVADYYARLLSWYTQGGFTDELGRRHESGHRFQISHWEVFGPGDELVEMSSGPFPPPWSAYAYAQRFVTRDGKRRLLLVSKRDRSLTLVVPGATPGQMQFVDQTTGPRPAGSRTLDDENVTLNGLAVAVVTLP